MHDVGGTKGAPPHTTFGIPLHSPFLSVAMALILRLAITTVGAVPGPGADAGNAWDTDSVSRASFVFVVAASSNRFLAPRVIVSAVAASVAVRLLLHHDAADVPSSEHAAMRRNAHRWALVFATTVALAFQVAVTLALHTHWSFDVVVALVVSHAAAAHGALLAPVVDSIMP